MTGRKVFLLGPGFIGGEIISILAKQDYDVTTLVRRESAAAELNKLGVHTVKGSLEDTATITEQARLADIVFHTATADDLPSAEAVLAGVRARAEAGQQSIYIHTSGASLLADDSAGGYASDVIFDDEDPAGIDALPDTAPHRVIDLAIVRAQRAFLASSSVAAKPKMAIMIPPLIYGVGRTGRLSIQYPTMARYAVKHGRASHVGAGRSLWNQVHVRDLARGYVAVLDYLRSGRSDGGTNPYWFCNNGEELAWGEAAARIGTVLHKAGRIADPTPSTMPPETYGDVFGDYTPTVAGSNSRNRANRLRALGWKAVEKPSLASLEHDEIPLILQEKGEFNGYAAPVAS